MGSQGGRREPAARGRPRPPRRPDRRAGAADPPARRRVRPGGPGLPRPRHPRRLRRAHRGAARRGGPAGPRPRRRPRRRPDGDWAAYDAPLWLVCTNGRRDRCCAEVGRPITAALAGRWPEATWETTHLGGHRFAGTLLALPSGHTLGRLDVASAVEACAILEKGSVPVEVSRGRAGLTPAEQVRELHALAGGDPDVDVVEVPAQPRRASCADLVEKPTTRWEVRAR